MTNTQVLQLAPTLVPDSTSECCMACRRAFTFFFRRHHCRFCGRLLCGDCSGIRIEAAQGGRLRACEKCLEAYTKQLQATREQRALQAATTATATSAATATIMIMTTPTTTTTSASAAEPEATTVTTTAGGSDARNALFEESSPKEAANGAQMRGRSFEHASNGRKAASGRPQRANTMLPSDRKSAAVQPASGTSAKKASYRKSLRSARSERLLKSPSISAISTGPDAETESTTIAPQQPSREEERQTAVDSTLVARTEGQQLPRLTEVDTPTEAPGDASPFPGPTTDTPTPTTTELDSLSMNSELSSLPGLDVIGMLPDVSLDATPKPAASAEALDEGTDVFYLGKDGVHQRATVLKVHYDDYPHFYYTIRFEGTTRERQTDASRLQRA